MKGGIAERAIARFSLATQDEGKEAMMSDRYQIDIYLKPLLTMKKILSLAIITLCFQLTGCSVFMAATQPPAKNISLFKVGTPKSLIIAEFGTPTGSECKNGKTYDIYAFQNGSAAGYKAGRVACWAVADFFTLGLAEIIGTPLETAFRTTDMAFEVSYDKNGLVDSVITLKK